MAVHKRENSSGSDYDLSSRVSDSSTEVQRESADNRNAKARESSHDSDVAVSTRSDRVKLKDGGSQLRRLANRRQERFMIRTHDERILARSLAHIEGDDLALHLFCTHHMKRRLYPIAPAIYESSTAQIAPTLTLNEQKEEFKDLRSWQAKVRWLGDRWDLHNLWTAWPLLPGEIPREEQNERFGKRSLDAWEDEDAGRAAKRPRPAPSGSLREVFVSEMLKRAKRRLEERGQVGSYASSAVHPGQSHFAATQIKPKRRRLVPLLDDEAAQSLLEPSIRGLLRKLDKLLLDLHTMRIYGRRWTTGDRDACLQKSTIPNFRSLPRDWSDVLGVAALTGCWNSNVIDRTSRRCADLVEEDMEFRTFGTQTTHSFAPRYDRDQTSRPKDVVRGPQRLDCAFKSHGTDSQTQIFPTLDALNKHMVEFHQMNYVAPRDRSTTNLQSRQMQTLVCPVPNCPLHNYISESESTWSAHLRQDHHWDLEKIRTHLQELQERLKDEEQEYSRYARSRLHHGLHVDGFLEEIPSVYKFNYAAEMATEVEASTANWPGINLDLVKPKHKPIFSQPAAPLPPPPRLGTIAFKMQGYGPQSRTKR